MNALRRFSTLLKDERFTKTSLRRQNSSRGHTNHYLSSRVKMRQNESKRLKARQMCVATTTTNATSKKPPLLIAQDTQKCTEHSTQIRGCVLVPRTQLGPGNGELKILRNRSKKPLLKQRDDDIPQVR